MSESRVERRPAAILAADVVGYSRMMGVDEEATLRRLTESRGTIDALVTEHHGRVFGSAGDSVVAEVASAVDAVRRATEVQQSLARSNAPLPPDMRMTFRIGINVGDGV